VKTFNQSSEKITNKWILENCDEPEPLKRSGYVWCRFDVEREEDGYLTLCVETIHDDREAFAFEIETGIQCAEGWIKHRVGIGLYTLLDDLKALLEILARGNHF
jgi:hypothetical protein